MATVTRKVYELRWQHDEGYYPVMVFADKEEADRVAAGSLKFLEEPDDDFARFAVVERDVIVGTGEWSRQDYIDALTMPRTEAGKRLLDEEDFTLDGQMHDPRLERAVAAIEAEAVVAERARIVWEVGKYIAHHNHEPGKNCVSVFCAAGLHAAVLRIVNQTA